MKPHHFGEAATGTAMPCGSDSDGSSAEIFFQHVQILRNTQNMKLSIHFTFIFTSIIVTQYQKKKTLLKILNFFACYTLWEPEPELHQKIFPETEPH
jgi:hypothetical protein